MYEFLGPVIFALFFMLSIHKLFLNRKQFSALTISQWVKFVFGFLLSIAIISVILIKGNGLVNVNLSGVTSFLCKVFVCLLGLTIGNMIFRRFILEPLIAFYDLPHNQK